MPKRSRNIPFNKEMAVPSKSIPRNWHKEQKPPIEQSRDYQEDDTNESTHKMQTPCRWFRVLAHVEGPELI
jgi:hypothetical protein